ncbi:sigma-70 family RNA polymerase sigma factor [Nocardioides mangrovicus]|uniref:sigma-70 family RNA polymerase sigma factor n=1 Tax=Nocardioides mangrovicus TaxID=2478913 RepID=UPI001E30F35D|nr:sigma-70 family RNA polymerase sigma factor [Nocardioides mangrovicus]
MADQVLLAEAFEAHRDRLRVVAQRLLGPCGGAEDAVQEAWLRLSRSDERGEVIESLGGWLTTVVSRICLDQLRRRATRPEQPTEQVPALAVVPDPAESVELADSVGAALGVVLETLSPLERLAFVLHDLFGVPFDQVAQILGSSPAAARQYASRGRRRVRGQAPTAGEAPDSPARRDVVAAFLAAAREGEFADLLQLLAPDVELRADATIVAMGGVAQVSGPEPVARMFHGRAYAARMALIDGVPGAAWWQGGVLRVAFCFEVADGVVRALEQVGDSERLERMVVEPL